ncbi:hypothetical protein IAT40_004801 [Kwoniella sp. CBS 6097]
MFEPRHIQNMSEAKSLEPHWGYADRAVPCTNDAGSCEYLDIVYHSHDLGMLYSGILWSVIIGGLLLWGLLLRSGATSSRISRTLGTLSRRWLLPDIKRTRFLFGRTTRLQVLVLACITAYLTVFSFVGIKYKTWYTPVKNSPGVYNRRSSLGPVSDRLGILAYALTPLSILLGSRESLLSVVTGIPYQHFNFLHRWLGHIIMLQAVFHTIFWCIIEIRWYQPQPKVAKEWVVQPYIVWGIVAMILLLVLWVLSTSYARRAFGYEFFRKAHYVLAMVYIGACWAHWAQLKCFMLPSLLLWFADRGARLVRTCLIHYRVLPDGRGMFQTIDAKITHFDSDVIRLDFPNPDPLEFTVGQHFYMCFTQGGIWQSHPFTPVSLPGDDHGYLIRAKNGETKRVADTNSSSTPVIITGPYGADILSDLELEDNVLCVAGGTGITFVLPVLLHLSRYGLTSGRMIELIWVVRHGKDIEWIASEIEELRGHENIRITIKTTRDVQEAATPQHPASISSKEAGEGSSSGSPAETPAATIDSMKEFDPEKAIDQGILPSHRPDLKVKVNEFIKRTVNGPTAVYVSGPGGMISDVRDEVAALNDAGKVWKGEEGASVRLIYDERLD